MLNSQNLRNEILHTLAAANNLLMELELKGDNVLKAADVMQRCHLLFNFMSKESSDEKEDNREITAGAGDNTGSND